KDSLLTENRRKIWVIVSLKPRLHGTQFQQPDKEVAIAQQKEIAAAIEDIKRKIAEYDLTAEELGCTAKRAKVARKAPLPPKYRNPKTGETWSGRGCPPG
ncbi:MAG: DNA-binding protein H-NS, partial [Candidatus Burkholderia crenata]